MEAYTSATTLLSYVSEESLYNADYDSSSGYDSTDIFDTASVTSHDSEDLVAISHHDNKDAVVFKSTHALCDNLKLILSMPELCDVTFLVGANQIPVYGVRAILGTRSRAFYQLILTHMRSTEENKELSSKVKKSSRKTTGISPALSSRLTITVKKYDPEVFRMLIQFVHCGSATITNENVAGLLCGASQFDLHDLSDACWDYVTRCLRAGEGERLLYGARSYSQHKTGQTLISMIYESLDKDTIRRLQAMSIKECSL